MSRRSLPVVAALALVTTVLAACSGGRAVSLAEIELDALITTADLPAESWRVLDRSSTAAELAAQGEGPSTNPVASCSVYSGPLASPELVRSRGFLATSNDADGSLSSASLSLLEYTSGVEVAGALKEATEQLSAPGGLQAMLNCIKSAYEKSAVGGAQGAPAVTVDSITGSLLATDDPSRLAYGIEFRLTIGESVLSTRSEIVTWAEGPLIASVFTSKGGDQSVQIDSLVLAATIRERLADAARD